MVVAGGHEERLGNVGSDAVAGDEGRGGGSNERVEDGVQSADLRLEELDPLGELV